MLYKKENEEKKRALTFDVMRGITFSNLTKKDIDRNTQRQLNDKEAADQVEVKNGQDN